MKKLSSIITVLIIMLSWGCTEVLDWTDPTDSVPPGVITDVRVKNTNGGAILYYTLPNDNDLLGAKAVYNFSESEEPLEVFASAFKDSLLIEGYADTDEHIIQLYAVDKSNNLSAPVSVTIRPLTPPVFEIRKSLIAESTFSGVRATWENPFQKPIVISSYTVDNFGEKALYERHYSSAADGGYTFRN